MFHSSSLLLRATPSSLRVARSAQTHDAVLSSLNADLPKAYRQEIRTAKQIPLPHSGISDPVHRVNRHHRNLVSNLLYEVSGSRRFELSADASPRALTSLLDPFLPCRRELLS